MAKRDGNTVDLFESLVGVVYVAGSLASAGLADVVPEYISEVSLMSTIPLLGQDVMWGSVVAGASLLLAYVVQQEESSEISSTGKKVIFSAAGLMVAVEYLPQFGDFVTGSLWAGLLYFVHGVVAYYYITYA